MLPEFSPKEEKRAERAVYRYIVKDYNSRGDLGSANGREMPKDLKDSILYESTFDECIWGGCDWTNLSGNGCHFSICDFFSSKIHDAALQHTLFDNAVFHNCDIRGSNFAYSFFIWSTLNRSPIIKCAFTGAIFNHVTLQDCEIAYSNFELCTFQNSIFRNIDLRNLALKYTFFHNVHMENVSLPFMQMPYTFGGMKYIFSTKDSIEIASMNGPNISVSEYRKMLPKMIIFFTGHKDYFPLANCYLANGRRDLAEQANEAGMVNSAAVHDFRKLYFFCIQAAQELDISRERRMQLYNRIHEIILSDRLNRAEYYEFRHYFPMIKQLMFDNPYNHPTLAISLHTNIAADDFDKLGLFMRTLDEVAENCGVQLDSKHIEIRHNSPNILDWFPVGDIDQLLHLLHNTWEVIYPVLSTALQDTANVATLITGVYSIHRASASKHPERLKPKLPLSNLAMDSPKSRKTKDTVKQELSDEQIEVLRLRTEQLKQERAWREDERNMMEQYAYDPKAIREKFQNRINALKAAGIHIETLEIQLLDDHCDILDSLYNQGEYSV